MKCIDIYVFQVGLNVLYPFKYMQKAVVFGLKGIVMQKGPDLFIEAEGDEKLLNEFVAWCRTSQFMLNYDENYIETFEATPKNYSTFEVLEADSELPIDIKEIEKRL
jgi:hypothetical protein